MEWSIRVIREQDEAEARSPNKQRRRAEGSGRIRASPHRHHRRPCTSTLPQHLLLRFPHTTAIMSLEATMIMFVIVPSPSLQRR